MSRRLDDLHPVFRPLAVEFLAQLTENGIHVLIVDTLRTEQEHQDNLRNGSSWTKRSLHLDGLAVDVAPFETYELHGKDKIQWDEKDPVWKLIGGVGKYLGLDWGGDWKTVPPDMGHFEHPRGTRIREIAPWPRR